MGRLSRRLWLVLRRAGEAVERQPVHVRLEHHLLVDDVVVRRLGVVLVQRPDPLLPDRSAGVDVCGEVVHQALGKIGGRRLAVAVAGVADVDRGLGAHVRLRPVELPLLVGRGNGRDRIRDVQPAVAAHREEELAVSVRQVGVGRCREVGGDRDRAAELRRLRGPVAVVRPERADVRHGGLLEEAVEQVLVRPLIRGRQERRLQEARKLRAEGVARRLGAVGEEGVTGRERRVQVELAVDQWVEVLVELPEDVLRRLDEPRDAHLCERYVVAKPRRLLERAVGAVGEVGVLGRGGVDRVPLREGLVRGRRCVGRREGEVVRLVDLGGGRRQVQLPPHRKRRIRPEQDDVLQVRVLRPVGRDQVVDRPDDRVSGVDRTGVLIPR